MFVGRRTEVRFRPYDEGAITLGPGALLMPRGLAARPRAECLLVSEERYLPLHYSGVIATPGDNRLGIKLL